MPIFDASRVCLAFDSTGVCGARVTPRLRGFELRAWARAALPEGALRPGAVERNLTDPDALHQALRSVAAALDLPPQAPVRAVLPDGLARLVLLDEPRGVSAEDFALFRLSPGLPYAPDEAVVGTLAAGRGRRVAAAVRRPVAAEYEAALRAADLAPESVLLAPLLVVGELLRQPPGRDEVAVILGDAALVLAVFREGRLQAVRSRRRDASRDEALRLADEAWRSAQAGGLKEPLRLALFGNEAAALAATLGLQGHLAQVGRLGPAALPAEAADWAWLGGAAA